MSINANTNSNPFINGLNVITTVQPTPTLTNNTTNLNSTFKDPLGDTWIIDNSGDAIKAGASGGTAFTVATHEVTATAGQTSFTLPNTPKDAIVWAFRNGARLPRTAMTISGSTATYVPTANNNNALFAGDRIQFDYLF
jgi:hypothetical protein